MAGTSLHPQSRGCNISNTDPPRSRIQHRAGTDLTGTVQLRKEVVAAKATCLSRRSSPVVQKGGFLIL